MSQYDDTNRGVLFHKDPESERHPNLNGNINIEGKEYWLSGWTKTSKGGVEYISLSVTPKETKEQNDKVPF